MFRPTNTVLILEGPSAGKTGFPFLRDLIYDNWRKKIISHFDIQIASLKYQIPIEIFF